MSRDYTEQAFVKSLRGADLTLGQYCTLVNAASYADGATGGNIRPGAPRLARDTGLAVETVYRNLTALVEKGYLIQVSRGRKGHASEYRINVDRMANPPMTPESYMTPASGKRRKRNHDRQPVNPDSRVTPPTHIHQAAKDGGDDTYVHACVRCGNDIDTPGTCLDCTEPLTPIERVFAPLGAEYAEHRARAVNALLRGESEQQVRAEIVRFAEHKRQVAG